MTQPHRKRMQRWETDGQVRFVTFSCEKRMPLMGSGSIRDVVIECLTRARDRFGFELFAWVVMPEHMHLLVRPETGTDLAKPLASFKQSASQRIVARWRDLDAPVLSRITRQDGAARFWLKGGGFDRNVRDHGEFTRHVRYVHRNPVERGLVSKPDDWRWSSVTWWMGRHDSGLQCDPSPGSYDWSNWEGYV